MCNRVTDECVTHYTHLPYAMDASAAICADIFEGVYSIRISTGNVAEDYEVSVSIHVVFFFSSAKQSGKLSAKLSGPLALDPVSYDYSEGRKPTAVSA